MLSRPQRWLEGWPEPTDLRAGDVIVVRAAAAHPTGLDVGSLPNLANKAAWRETIQENLSLFCRCLNLRAIWPSCDICPSQHTFEHCTSERHFREVWYKVEGQTLLDYLYVREGFWQTLSLPGGGIRWNHLDASVEVFGGLPPPPASHHPPYIGPEIPLPILDVPGHPGSMVPPPPYYKAPPTLPSFNGMVNPPRHPVPTRVPVQTIEVPVPTIEVPVPSEQLRVATTWKIDIDDSAALSKLFDELRSLASPLTSRGQGRRVLHVALEVEGRRPLSPDSSSSSNRTSVSNPATPPTHPMPTPPISPVAIPPVLPDLSVDDSGSLAEGDRVIVEWYGELHNARINHFFGEDGVRVLFEEELSYFDTTRSKIRRI